MKLFKIIILLAMTSLAASCTAGEARDPMEENLSGSYVSEGYFRRDEGYDWIRVVISPRDEESVDIEVRSREDIKKPTCTFDGVGIITDDSTIRSLFEGRSILFIVEGDILTIEAEDKGDRNLLYYFCSGGASLRGTYRKTE